MTVGVVATLPPSPAPLAPTGFVGLGTGLTSTVTAATCRRGAAQSAGTLRAYAELGRQTGRDERHLRDLSDRHRAIGAGDRKLAVGEGYAGGATLDVSLQKRYVSW
jgi:hypothetical protein